MGSTVQEITDHCIVPREEDHITKDRIRLASRLSMTPRRAPKSLGAFPKKPPVVRQLADVLEEGRDTERKHYLEQKTLRSVLPPSLDVTQLTFAMAPGPKVNHRFWSPRGPREVQIPQSLLNPQNRPGPRVNLTAESPPNRQQHMEPPDPAPNRPGGTNSGPTDPLSQLANAILTLAQKSNPQPRVEKSAARIPTVGLDNQKLDNAGRINPITHYTLKNNIVWSIENMHLEQSIVMQLLRTKNHLPDRVRESI